MSQKQGSYYFSLTILHYVMILGVLIFCLIAAGLQANGKFSPNESLGEILVPLSIGVALGGVFLSDFLFKKEVANISGDHPLYTRQQIFSKAFLVRLALVEGPALFCTVTYLLTGAWIALLGSLLLIGWMAFKRPTMAVLKKYLFLTKEEETEMFG